MLTFVGFWDGRVSSYSLDSAPTAGSDSSVWFTVHPESVLLLCIPNVFSFSSIPFSSLILPPSFHPPPQYEPYLNNVEAPHLIRCLVGQSTRALIKNKQKKQQWWTLLHEDGQEDNMCERTHTCWCCAYEAITKFTPSALGCLGSTFIRSILIITHISNCFYDIGSVAIIPYVVMLECPSSLRPRTEYAGDALKSNHGLKIISTS